MMVLPGEMWGDGESAPSCSGTCTRPAVTRGRTDVEGRVPSVPLPEQRLEASPPRGQCTARRSAPTGNATAARAETVGPGAFPQRRAPSSFSREPLASATVALARGSRLNEGEPAHPQLRVCTPWDLSSLLPW